MRGLAGEGRAGDKKRSASAGIGAPGGVGCETTQNFRRSRIDLVSNEIEGASHPLANVYQTKARNKVPRSFANRTGPKPSSLP
jgi:hypothetical protein